MYIVTECATIQHNFETYEYGISGRKEDVEKNIIYRTIKDIALILLANASIIEAEQEFFFLKKKIITLIMLARSPERNFRIGNIILLEEANTYILPQTAGR